MQINQLRQTHTFTLMQVSEATYNEIKQKLVEADYNHALLEQNGQIVLDMHGIGLTNKEID